MAPLILRARRAALILSMTASACGPAGADAPDAADSAAAAGARAARPATARDAVAPPPSAPIRIPTYGRITPVDDALNDVGFAAFRDTALRIVAARDTSALLAIVAPEIRNSFGGNDGVAAFRTAWRLGEADSELWAVLDDILRHGGRFSGADAFVAPFTYMALPDSLDPFEFLMVRDEDVPVYATPDEQGVIVGRLSHDVVRAGPYLADPRWTAIALGGERFGYVEAHRIRSAVDYRVQFMRRDGRWLLVLLVAGD